MQTTPSALWCRPHPQHCGAGHTLSIVVQTTPSALWCRPHPQHCGADHTLSIVVQATPSALWCKGCHTHCLSCHKSADRHFRHPALNSQDSTYPIMSQTIRALQSRWKTRLDGITLASRKCGQLLISYAATVAGQ